MKKLFRKTDTLALTLLGALALLFALPAPAAQYQVPSLIRGTQMVLTNTLTYTNNSLQTGVNGTNTTTAMVYTPILSEQYPVGFGGGTNWWANGWTTYTNSSGIIVTNPLPLLQTNQNWWATAQYYANSSLAAPTVGLFLSVQSTNGTASTTNGITITLEGSIGTNLLNAAANQLSITFTWTGTNLYNVATNLPATLLQNCDRLAPYQIVGLGTNSLTLLNQLALTYWSPVPTE